ncbi:MAG TPA: PfkB family carbohydrate kinase, partial [Polyangiaceae bacterium]|nr:PfkB family carbohydrate kinase [Polyangiaceae bacterium]
MTSSEIVVVGSLNVDLVMRARRRPERGETVLGESFHLFTGGKGMNQAIAAARAGARVEMVGRVGVDPFATMLLGRLDADGVGRRFVIEDALAGTGVADIVVDDAGGSSIIV